MAGDWIKVEMTTPDKPEIAGIADDLNIDIDMAFGKVFRVWAWFDQHSTDGHAPSVTKKTLDRVAGVQGFCDAMAKVEWFEDDGEFITMPNFERHNGESAKKRALASDRKRKSRNKSDNVTEVSRSGRDKNGPKSVTREEVEKSNKTSTTSTAEVEFDDRGRFKIHDDWAPGENTFPAVCLRAGVKPEYVPEQLGNFINFHIDEARNTFRSNHDWERMFCSWLKGDQSNGKGGSGNGGGPSGGGSGKNSSALSEAERAAIENGLDKDDC